MARTPRPKLDPDSVTPLADLFGPALLQPLRQFIDQPRRREQADAHSNRRLFLSAERSWRDYSQTRNMVSINPAASC